MSLLWLSEKKQIPHSKSFSNTFPWHLESVRMRSEQAWNIWDLNLITWHEAVKRKEMTSVWNLNTQLLSLEKKLLVQRSSIKRTTSRQVSKKVYEVCFKPVFRGCTSLSSLLCALNGSAVLNRRYKVLPINENDLFYRLGCSGCTGCLWLDDQTHDVSYFF